MTRFRNSAALAVLLLGVPGLAAAQGPRVLVPPLTPQEQASPPATPSPRLPQAPAGAPVAPAASESQTPMAPMAPAEVFVPPEPSDPFADTGAPAATASPAPTAAPQAAAPASGQRVPWEKRLPRGVTTGAAPGTAPSGTAPDSTTAQAADEAVPPWRRPLPEEAPATTDEVPTPLGPPGDRPQPQGGDVSQGGGLALSPLAPPNVGSVGLLDPGQGGLGTELWHGTDEATARAVIEAMPAPMASPAAGDLARRLLLTRATAPAASLPRQDPALPPGQEPSAGAGAGAEPSAGERFLAARLDRLVTFGDFASATRLADLARITESGDAVARGAAGAALLAGDLRSACQYAARTGASEAERAFFAKLRCLCFLDQGNLQAARVQADLMGEQGLAAPVFVAGLIAVQYPREPLPQTAARGEIGAAEFALLRRTGRAAPAGLFAEAAPFVQRAIALDRASEFRALRLTAAEAAFLEGAMTADELKSLAERSVAVAPDAGDEGTERAGALVQDIRALVAIPVPAERAVRLAGVLARTTDPGRYIRIARLFAGDIAGLQAERGLGPASLELARVALLAGQAREAQAFIDLFEVAPYSGERVASQPALLTDLSLALFVAAPELGESWRLSTASQALNAADLGQASGPRVTLALTLLEALGYRLPPELGLRLSASQLAGGARVASPADLAQLEAAGQARRVGETVARALAIIGPEGPWTLDGAALRTVVKALASAGLEKEARSLATEALLAHGLGAARG